MLTSEQDEQDLSQSCEASSESIRSASCVLSKQPQVNAFKLAFCMFRKTNKLGQEAILYWCFFIEKYDKSIDNLVAGGVKKKTATSMVYQKIKQLLPDITGIEKIKQVSYSADAI
ncbi:4143_t:CDS:2 [Funneliformis geosporum]|nr:4143_t:CDS:2 [Funneliformis geosporum]